MKIGERKLTLTEMGALAALLYNLVQANDWRLMSATNKMFANAGFRISDADYNRSHQALMGIPLAQMTDILKNWGLVRTGHNVDPLDLNIIQRYIGMGGTQARLDVSYQDFIDHVDKAELDELIEYLKEQHPELQDPKALEAAFNDSTITDDIVSWFSSRENKDFLGCGIPFTDRLVKMTGNGLQSYVLNYMAGGKMIEATANVKLGFDFYVPESLKISVPIAGNKRPVLSLDDYEMITGKNTTVNVFGKEIQLINPLPLVSIGMLYSTVNTYNNKLIEHEAAVKDAIAVNEALNEYIHTGGDLWELSQPGTVSQMARQDRLQFAAEHVDDWKKLCENAPENSLASQNLKYISDPANGQVDENGNLTDEALEWLADNVMPSLYSDEFLDYMDDTYSEYILEITPRMDVRYSEKYYTAPTTTYTR